MGSTGFVSSFGGSGLVILAERVRLAPCVNGLPEENDGERLDLSRRASDQLNPSGEKSAHAYCHKLSINKTSVGTGQGKDWPRLLPAVLAVPDVA